MRFPPLVLLDNDLYDFLGVFIRLLLWLSAKR